MTESTSPPNDGVIRRLVYAKHLFGLAERLLALDTPFADAEAIVLFDATVESVLKTALDQRPRESGIGREPHLGAIYTAVGRAYGSQGRSAKVGNEMEILRLHEVRNSIQHQSIPPAREEVLVQVDAARRNISEIAKTLFSLDWGDLSISVLFRDAEVRSLFERSELALKEGRLDEAVYSIVGCFETARFLEQHRIWGSFITFARGAAQDDGVLEDPNHEAIVNYVSVLNDEVEVLKLRLDYKEYRAYADIAIGVITPTFEGIATTGDSVDEISSYWKLRLQGHLQVFQDGESFSPPAVEELTKWLHFAHRFTSEAVLRWQHHWRPGAGE